MSKSSTTKKALEAIERRGRAGASALEIGKAVAKRRKWMSVHALEALGLKAATKLVHDELVTATRCNLFVATRYQGRYVPSPVVSDALGFRRVA